jgi:hypothetical protein
MTHKRRITLAGGKKVRFNRSGTAGDIKTGNIPDHTVIKVSNGSVIW